MKVTGYTAMYKNQLHFYMLAIHNQKLKLKINIYSSIKIIHYLRINPTKMLKDMYTENNKILL